MHPMLLPGTHVLRRDSDTLQAGLDPQTRVCLPDTPSLRRLSTSGSVEADETHTVRLGPLTLADDRALRAALPRDNGDPELRWARHSLAALAREARDELTERLAGRADLGIRVHAYGGALADDLADDLRRTARRTGLQAPDRFRPGPRTSGDPSSTLALLVGVGEVSRAKLDPLLQDGRPHLLLRFCEGVAVLGPLVVPGVTACLRCVDAHLAAGDPAWPLLVEQHARVTRTDRLDGVPEPVDAALANVAVGWMIRDVAAYAEGRRPLTWSSTLRLTEQLTEVETRVWPAHPRCGCHCR